MSSIIRNKKKKKSFADEIADLMMPAPRAGECCCCILLLFGLDKDGLLLIDMCMCCRN